MSWQFQYWNGSAWVNFSGAQVDHVLEELSSVGGQEELVFDLLNTSANRAIVQALPFVQCLFNGTLIFPLSNQNAVVAGLKYTTTTIEVTAYNVVFAKLSQASGTVTQTYTNTAVGAIAAYICGLSGVSAGSMPNLNVSIKFSNANCFKAMQDLANACGCDYWADGNGFNIGTRDSTVQTLGWVGSNSQRGLDYSKQVDQVIVNGVDVNGNTIQGIAGSPGAVATFTEKKAADVATLNNVAAFKLQTLNNPSNGNSLECLISQVATWHPGQYVNSNRADFDLVGSFIIQRITKYVVTCTVEVDAAMPQMDVNLQETDDFAGSQGDLANYPISASQISGLQSAVNELSINIQNQTGNSPTTAYVKGSCVLGDGAVVAAPTGAMVSYEAGYTCLALLAKNGSGEWALVQKILDCYAALQNSDGSWYQQYVPGKMRQDPMTERQ